MAEEDILQRVKLEGAETVVAQLRELADAGREAIESIVPKGVIDLEFTELEESLDQLRNSFERVARTSTDISAQMVTAVAPAMEIVSDSVSDAGDSAASLVEQLENVGTAAMEAAAPVASAGRAMEDMVRGAESAGQAVTEFSDEAVDAGEQTKSLWDTIVDSFLEGFDSVESAAETAGGASRGIASASRLASVSLTDMMTAFRGVAVGGGQASSQLMVLTGTLGRLMTAAAAAAPVFVALGAAMLGISAANAVNALQNLAFSIGQTTQSVEEFRAVLVAMGVSTEQAGAAASRFSQIMSETDRQARNLINSARSHAQSMQQQSGAFDQYEAGLRRVQEQYAELRHQQLKAIQEGRYTQEFVRQQTRQQAELGRTWAQLKRSIENTDDSLNQAGTNFRRLQADTVEAGTALLRLGISVKDSSGNFRPLMDVAEEFAAKIGQIPDETQRAQMALDTFGAEAGRKFLEAVSQGSDAFAKFREESDNLIPKLTDVEKKVAGDFSEAWNQMWAVVGDVMNRIGLAVLPVFTDIAEAITKFVSENRDDIKTFFTSIFTSVWNTITGLAKVFEYTVLPIFRAVVGIIDVLVKAFNALTGQNMTTVEALGKLAAFLLTWWVRMGVSVVAFVGNAISYLEKFVDWIGQIDFRQVVRDVEEQWKKIEQYVKVPLDILTSLVTDFEGTVNRAFEAITEYVKNKWTELLDWLVSKIPEPLKQIGRYFLGIPASAQQAADQIRPALNSVATDAKKVGDQFQQTGSQIKNSMDSVNASLTRSGTEADKAGEEMRDAAQEGDTSWTSWLSRLGTQIDTVIERLRQMTSAANEAASATQGAAGGGGGGSGYSGGGPVRGAGTSTSDSIPIWASDGEFMIRTAAVRKYGIGLMHAINSLRFSPQGFADGGLVAAVARFPPAPVFNLPAFAGGGPVTSPGRPLTLHVGGEVIEGLSANEDAYSQLERLSALRSMSVAGRRPSSSGRR